MSDTPNEMSKPKIYDQFVIRDKDTSEVLVQNLFVRTEIEDDGDEPE
jgi:hypothetical protein